MQIGLKAEPNRHWAPAREVRSRAQRALAEAGIRTTVAGATGH
ncbi:hypothetical protein [Tessaracoccus coleopterorum]|nr:hypothetical protein [Tessaracoccus coleopterorum]